MQVPLHPNSFHLPIVPSPHLPTFPPSPQGKGVGRAQLHATRCMHAVPQADPSHDMQGQAPHVSGRSTASCRCP